MDIREKLIKQANLELSRRNFFHYCTIKDPKFFKYDREYQKELATGLQDFMEGDENLLVVNVPPRFGKSYSATKFVEWVLGNNPEKKIMTASYNEKLSTNFAKSVRNSILENKADEGIVVYNDIFPKTKIKRGEASMNLWALEGQYNTYLATSPTGTATGFGASLIIVDDLVKNAYEANNAMILEAHWEWFRNTMISRLEDGGKIIIIMTRWHSDDLAGKALKEMPDMGFKIKHINMKAQSEDGKMLCEDILSEHDYGLRVKALGQDIVSANYNQEPIDLIGKLYKPFSEYDELPKVISEAKAYIDTADTGNDYLAGFIYVTDKDEDVFIKDIIYTQDAMEETEPLTARKLVEHDVRSAVIESNNGGRGFRRAVEKEVKNVHKVSTVKFSDLHQSKNKEARIISNATTVQSKVYFPSGWKTKHPEAYEFFSKYQRKGKNAHDDLADAITGVVEMTVKGNQKMQKGGTIHGKRRPTERQSYR